MLPLPTHHPIAIKEMTAADIVAVQALAQHIWRSYYPNILSSAQIDYMLELMYSQESLKAQMESNHRFWLIYADEALAGFASIEQQAISHWHIHKFYIDSGRHRQGLGSALMRHAITAMQAKKLTLGVNRKNIPAINFYFRQGFTITKTMDKDIGNGFTMEDFLMERIA